jgi:hypothetical protein
VHKFCTTLMEKTVGIIGTLKSTLNSDQFYFSALSLYQIYFKQFDFILFYSDLIVYKEGTVAMLEGGVGVQDSIVGLHNGRRHLHQRSRVHSFLSLLKASTWKECALSTNCHLMHENDSAEGMVQSEEIQTTQMMTIQTDK